MNKNLLILCDSAYGTVAKEIALSMGCFEKVDILNQYFGVPEAEGEYHEISIGKLEDYESFAGTYSFAVAAFEDSHTRLTWSDKLIEAGFAIISLVSPKAYVSFSAQIDQGCIIEPLAGVNSNVSVGACSIIKMGALINHNSIIAEGCCCENYSIIKTTSPAESGQVRIPEESSEVFDRYNALQKSQGYDLSKYAGKKVMRYVYRINNYPGATEPVYATLLVYKNEIIGGDITDTAAKGHIRGFKMPESAATTPAETASATGVTQ